MNEAESICICLRYLDLEVEVQVSDRATASIVEWFTPKTTHAAPPMHKLQLELSHKSPIYQLVGPAFKINAHTASSAVQAVHSVATDAMLHSMPFVAAISAVTLVHKGRSILLVGGPESGRSTLALALAMAGYEVGGDDYALVQQGLVAPMPGRFSIWQSSLRLIAEIPGAERWQALNDVPIQNVRLPIDPTYFGGLWRVSAAPVGAVLLLEPNFGGRSRVRQIQGSDMTRMVLGQSHHLHAEQGRSIREICSILASANTAVLEIGNLTSAVQAITTFLERRVFPTGTRSPG